MNSKMLLCFGYWCNHNSFRKSCKFYKVLYSEHPRAWPVYTGCLPVYMYTTHVLYTAVFTARVHGHAEGPRTACVHDHIRYDLSIHPSTWACSFCWCKKIIRIKRQGIIPTCFWPWAIAHITPKELASTTQVEQIGAFLPGRCNFPSLWTENSPGCHFCPSLWMGKSGQCRLFSVHSTAKSPTLDLPGSAIIWGPPK